MTIFSRIWHPFSVESKEARENEERVSSAERKMAYIETQIKLFRLEKERIDAQHK